MHRSRPDCRLAAFAFLTLLSAAALASQTSYAADEALETPAPATAESPAAQTADTAAPSAYPPAPPVIETPSKAGTIEILPAKSVNTEDFQIDPNYQTHPPVRLTPDKSELIRLDQDAVTVIVGNPLHLNVLADNPKSLIMVGRAPGATHFLALNAKGEVIMQRHVIVAAPKEKYVRIRSSCASSNNPNCQTTRVYYCPDMCHEVLIDNQSAGSAQGALTAGAEGQNAAAGAQALTDATGATPGEPSGEEIP